MRGKIDSLTLLLTNLIRVTMVLRRSSIIAVVAAVAACCLVGCVSSLSLQQNNNNNKNAGGVSSRRAFSVEGATAAVTAVVGIATLTSLPNVALAGGGGNNDDIPVQGSKAPDFELENSRGNGVTTLDELVKNGKWTVLYFYPGAFTSGCTLEARGFQRDLEEYRKLNTQIVGVSVDPVEKNAQFCSEEKLDFFMLSDKGGMVSKKYGSALSIPGFGTFSNRQTYIIDPQGSLRWIFTDVESRISRHSSEVLEKLNELEKA